MAATKHFCIMSGSLMVGRQTMGREVKRWLGSAGIGMALFIGLPLTTKGEEVSKYQYEFGSIRIPRAEAGEPTRHEVSVELATKYVEEGAVAWTRNRKCVTCHTNGTYMALRPSLIGPLGKPSQEVRDLFVTLLRNGIRQLGEDRRLETRT